MGQIGHYPEIERVIRLYNLELATRKMPSQWSNSEVFHQASLYYNDDPITTVLFAPLDSEDHRAVYITGAYTSRVWRRNGLYCDLMRICINQWRAENKYDWLRSGFHSGNHESRAMQLKQGREIYEEVRNHFRTRLSLKPTGDEFQLSEETLHPILSKLDRLSG